MRNCLMCVKANAESARYVGAMPEFGNIDRVGAAPRVVSDAAAIMQRPDATGVSGKAIAFAPRLTKERVRDALRDVIDADRGCNIVDLGLIHGIEVADNGAVCITMTMTAPDCPARGHIMSGVRERMKMIAGVGEVKINLVWQPRWSPQRMNRAPLRRARQAS